ncbi:unnamed protein product, partial [Urochloa humidicola]
FTLKNTCANNKSRAENKRNNFTIQKTNNSGLVLDYSDLQAPFAEENTVGTGDKLPITEQHSSDR